MRQRLIGIGVLVVVAMIAGGIVWQRRGSPAAKQDRLVRAFVALLPDSLPSEQRLEIEQLFYTFYLRAAQGDVAGEDVQRINQELARHVERGRIARGDLIHLMSDVGYTSYKLDPRYNLPDKSVDHPVLNPEAGMYAVSFDSSQYDSAFWADFAKWKQENYPELKDSTSREETPAE
jgi:hypothetical protein